MAILNWISKLNWISCCIYLKNHKGYVRVCDYVQGYLQVFMASFKVGLSPCKKVCVIYFIESPLKIMKNAFYFTLKALFILKIFKFLSWIFGHVGKTAWLER